MVAAVVAVATAGHCKSSAARTQLEAPAQTNSNGLNMNGVAVVDEERRRRAQQSASARGTSANQKGRAESVKRSELSFSNNLQQNGVAVGRRQSETAAKRQQVPAQVVGKQIQATRSLQPPPPPPAATEKRSARCEAPKTGTKFSRRRPQVAANGSNLRHWQSSTSPLNELPLDSRSRRSLVGLASACKSLHQLNCVPPQASPTRRANTCRAGRQAPTSQSVEAPPRIKQVLAASRACAAASQLAQRRARTTTSAGHSSGRPTAAARALLLSRTTPKRALSCNQLAARLEEQPKIAKTTASPAVTNSRVRQGLLFARRQCQLAPPFQSVENLSASLSRRSSHLTTTRVNSQQFDRRQTITSAATKSRQVVTTSQLVVARKQPASARPLSPLKAISKTETKLISHSADKTRKLVVVAAAAAASAPKRSLEVALHLHRRWSSLESSNQDEDDDDDEQLSSPSSSSSSTLSGSDPACLLLATPQALDYLAPAATGCNALINQQAVEGERRRHIGRRSSLQTRATANQPRRPKPQTIRRTSDGGTRQRPTFEPAEGRSESALPADGVSIERSRQRHCKQVGSDIELERVECENVNEDQACGNDCEPLDVADIVVEQPKRDCHFHTEPTPSGEQRTSSQLPHPTSCCEFPSGTHIDSSSQRLGDITSNNENEGPTQTKSMLLADQPSQNEPLAEPNIETSYLNDLHRVDGFQAIPCEHNQPLASSIALSNLVADVPVKDQNKMMISADQSDTKTTSQRWPIIEDTSINNNNNNNNHQTGPESGSDSTNAHHQPLGPLQAINCDQRKQSRSKENSDSDTSELKSNPIATQKQLPTQQRSALIPIRQEPIYDYYDLEPRPFARGKFAQVKRCVKLDTKECFAAKCIKKRRRLVDIRHEILLEIEALKLSSRTEHIVKIYEVFETPNEMILILEMASGGELQRVLDDEESISEPLVCKMVRQILEGLISLHDDQIVHLDLKPQNLLLTKPFPNGDIKLCDFGISRRITECEIREICGTPDYTAPEVLQYDPISLNTDMWSLGVVTYVLLSGYSPFGSENRQQTFCNITTCSLDFPSELFENVSPDAIDFVRKLIVLEPSQRLTSRQALNHRWFSR